MSPLANAYLEPTALADPETFYPLHVYVCDECLLVQLPVAAQPSEIFDDYAYFSSYSDSWVAHAQRYVEQVSDRFSIGSDHFVVELASNDGYLLQFFRAAGVAVLGVEPAANVAEEAVARGVPTIVEFFGAEVGRTLAARRPADLIVGNNVLAHVPDVHDFVEGIASLLAPEGVVTMEFPHLLRLMQERQFDTIYHEHYSYFSLLTASRALERHGLAIFDVEEVPTHGGSLRIYAGHAPRSPGERVLELQERERAAELEDLATYTVFADRVRREKREIVRFFIEQKEAGVSIAGYGAPAKGNTLLNYCGIGRDFIDYTVDLNPHKQGRFLPGTRIPILDPDEIRRTQPDLVFILPWNIRDEVMEQLAFVRDWGGRFAARSPEIRIFP
jgi:SAM-dependent methyltransferase